MVLRPSRLVGRVGALAVALGVGVVLSPGLAFADSETAETPGGPSDTSSSSPSPESASSKSAASRSGPARSGAASGAVGPAPRGTSAGAGAATTPLPSATVGVESDSTVAQATALPTALAAVAAGSTQQLTGAARADGSGSDVPAPQPLMWAVLGAARRDLGRRPAASPYSGGLAAVPAAATAGPAVAAASASVTSTTKRTNPVTPSLPSWVPTAPKGPGSGGQGASGAGGGSNGNSGGSNGNSGGSNGNSGGGTTTTPTTPATGGGTTTTPEDTTPSASGPTGGGPANPTPAVDLNRPHAAGEVLIGWVPGAAAEGRAQALAMIQAKVIDKLGTQAMLGADQGVYRLQVPGGTSAAIQALSNNPAVAFVEPNYQVTSGAIAQDSYYSSGALWGMQSDDSPTAYGPTGTTNQFGSGAEEAWGVGYTGSRSVVVAVLDEGIQITHPDLAANIWVNPGEVAGDGIDNDANGFIDDVNGWDFYYDDKTVYDAGEDAHGTHVAGTIGAVGGNSTGVAGVNWNVTIIPTKFLGPQGGYISDAVAAMNYLTDLKTRYNIDLVAVNNSWGGGGYSSAMHGAINRAAKADILFVAAAGNSTSNNDTTASYPSNYSSLQAAAGESAASYESVIAVASITSTGALSSFSSYGATTVDLGAPGSGIISTVPTNSYANYSGTSMATPHVTGALALYRSYNTTTDAAGLRNAILGNVKPTTALTGMTATGGRLSLEGLFSGVTPPPVLSTYDPTVSAISLPRNVRRGTLNNVTVTVGNLGNTGVLTTVSLAVSGGTAGGAKSVFVPAGGTVTTSIPWTAPAVRGTNTVTATAQLADGALTDANTANNSRTATVSVK